MRLTEKEIKSIRDVILGMDQAADIYRFGSHADDNKRGGDIDLLISSDKLTNADRRMIRIRLYDRLGEQKIDIVLEKEVSETFARIAKAEGVLLASGSDCTPESAKDETDYLLSTSANRASIDRSLDQLKRGDVITKSPNDLEIH